MAKKELSPEIRILLAFALSFLILWLGQPLLVRPPQPASPPPAAQGEGNQLHETPESPAPPAASEIGPPPLLEIEPKQGETEQEITVEGDLYRVVFSTRGAVVKSWTLRQYRDEQGQPLELVNSPAAAEFGYPLTLWPSDEAVRREINSALFVPSVIGQQQAPVTIVFEYSSGQRAVRKEISFSRDGYVAELETRLASDGIPLPHGIAWPGGFGDVHDVGMRGSGVQVFYREPQRMTLLDPGDVEGQESTASGMFPFAGIQDHFFTAVFLPEGGPLRITAFRQEVAVPDQERRQPSLGVAVGSGEFPENRLRLYVGPKLAETLAAVDPLLPGLIDYGWFTFIAKPLFVAMRWIHDHIVANYGWSIVLLTVFINTLLFPLKIKSLRSSMKMQKLQPQIRAIQEKYKQYKMNDPRKQEMSRETMALYKKHGVNPLGGCLPMLLQIPFLYGFYKVLIVSIEMRHAPWILWVQDLSAPEPITVKVLPLLMCGTQFLLQKMSPTPSPDPAQQKIMMFMPVMFLFFFWNLSSGLVLYWLTGNLVGIAQQWYINRTEMKHVIEERKNTVARKKKGGAKK